MQLTHCPLYPEWNDDERMNSLFSWYGPDLSQDFILFWTNAILWSGFGSKMLNQEESKFQKVAHPLKTSSQKPSLDCLDSQESELHLLRNCQYPPSLFIDLSTLPERFKRKGITPTTKGLSLVVEMMLQKRLLIEEKTHLSNMNRWWNSSHWLVQSLVSTPSQWIWSRIFGKQEDHVLCGRVLLLPLANMIADAVFDACHSLTPIDRVFCLPCESHLTCGQNESPEHISFLKMCRKYGFSQKTTAATKLQMTQLINHLNAEDVLSIAYLLCETGRAVLKDNCIKIIQKNEVFQKEDHEVVMMHHTLTNINESMERMMERLQLSRQQAIASKKKGDIKLALKQFKLSKSIESVRDQRQEVYFNLSLSLDKLREMHQNKQVMEAYSLSSQCLKKTREELGLTVDKVEKTVEDWHDGLAEHNEITCAMNIEPTVQFDEEELERELNLLDNESKDILETNPLEMTNLKKSLPHLEGISDPRHHHHHRHHHVKKKTKNKSFSSMKKVALGSHLQ